MREKGLDSIGVGDSSDFCRESMRTKLFSVLGMVRIEIRRSVGLLALPLLLAVAFLMGWGYAPMIFYLWVDTSVAIRSSVLLIGPLIGGLSAWVAIRNKRRGIEEMLSITPRPPVLRDLTTWAGTAFWGVAAYSLFGVVLLALTYPNTTWGAPLPAYILVGLLAVIAASAFGFAAGHFLQSRFTAPAVAVAIFITQGMVADSQQYSLLSPASAPLLGLSVFTKVPQVALPQSLLLAGLGGAALVLVALKHRRDKLLAWFALACFCVIGAIGTVASVEASPRVSDEWGSDSTVPFEPVCEEGRITVCVHPAYAASLPEAANSINEVAQPLAGFSGLPAYALAGQASDYPRKYRKNAATFYMGGWSGDWSEYAAQDLAYSFVANEDAGYGGGVQTCESDHGETEYWPSEEAQNIVADWLAIEARVHSERTSLSWCLSSTRRAEKLADMEPAKRRAWLEENLEDLQEGRLTPKDYRETAGVESLEGPFSWVWRENRRTLSVFQAGEVVAPNLVELRASNMDIHGCIDLRGGHQPERLVADPDDVVCGARRG